MTHAPVPRVSILMTVYNASEFVRIAVDSVLAQSLTDWELIVVDDGSTDGSTEILTSYTDERIRVTALLRNVGRTPALRRAFEMARGEYFAVLDADDISRPDRLETQVAYLDAHPDVLLVGSWARYIDASGVVVGGWRPTYDLVELRALLGWTNPVVHSSAMYRGGVASEEGGYALSLPYAQDCGLWLRLAARGSVAMIPEELCDQRIVAVSMTRGQRFRADVARDSLSLFREARRLIGFRGQAARRNRDAIMIAAVKWGLAQHRTGHSIAGTITILGAALRNPLGLVRSRAYRKQYIR